MLPKLTDTTQTISFSEGDGVCSSEVYANEVVVTTNAGSHNHGSSMVKLKNLVDYSWEPKFYSGKLLAIHMSGKYLAYCIKAANSANPGTWNGMVRVVYYPEPGIDRRALIKGMKGEVQDLAFAYIQNQVVLACIDEQGNFYVHEIAVTDGGLRCTLIAEVREDSGIVGTNHRVVWCPYIPDEDDDAPEDDVARLLLTTHAHVARLWDVGAAAGGQLPPAAAAAEHAAHIVDAAFSPDGTALATAAADGLVMFFQVYMRNESSPRCLHKWQPHGGKPLSCLFFLDDHKSCNTDVQFWKFAVTGAENNTVIKIWSCKSWSCLQTITFTPGVASEPSPGLKAMLDTSASYLVLSDFKTRSLYVLNMARDEEDATAYCKSISEFLLPYPVLSFVIVDAEEDQVKCQSSCDDPFHTNGSGEDGAESPADMLLHDESPPAPSRQARLRLYIVQPKGLQEGELVYRTPEPAPVLEMSELTIEPAPEETAPVASSILQQQSQQLKNLLMRSQTQPGSLIVQRAESPTIPPPPLNLMTPDAFSSPGKRDEDDPPLSATPDVSVVSAHSKRASVGLGMEEAVAAAENKPTSGGSSPSREVQQIMASDHGYYAPEEEEEEEEPAVASPVEAANETETMFEAETYEQSQDGPLPAADASWASISIPPLESRKEKPAPAGLSDADRARLDAIEHKIDNLTAAVQAQARALSAARPRDDLRQHVADVMLPAMDDGWERVVRAGEAAGARAASAAGAGAARALEPLAAALHRELAAKLTATDALLKQNVEKLARSKTLMESLSTAIAGSLAELVRKAFREALAEVAVPAVEKAHHRMFREVNAAFLQGTREFAAQTEAAARAAAERGGAGATAALLAALERHSAELAALQPRAALRDAARSVLEKELLWWREQARALVLQSRAHSPATPAPSHHDRQMQVAQVQSLLSAGDVNGAFQLALSAADLSLVVAACRACEPAAAFGPPPRLQQHVLLSLVQQLAADMTRDTALKHRYLEEAVMNLDTTNAVTREHLPVVIRELQKQIMSFLAANPGHALTRQFKVLLMATESLVKSV